MTDPIPALLSNSTRMFTRPTRCAGPACHHLLDPTSERVWFCSELCLMLGVVERWRVQVAAAFESLRPIFEQFANSFAAAAERMQVLFEFVLVSPKRTGPRPLAIDGHAYRNRTRRRTRRNTTRRTR